MHSLIAWFTRNPIAANLMMCLILGGGLYAVSQRLPLEVFPAFEVEQISVNIALPGASPEEAEESLAIPVEEAIQDVIGIERIISRSREGATRVSAEIDARYDVYRVKDEIKNRIDALNTLPPSAERPVISQLLQQREVISASVFGQLSEQELRQLATEVRDDLLQQPGITQVKLESVRPYEISISVPEFTLREYGLTLQQVADAITHSSQDLSAGTIKTRAGEILLRGKGQAYYGYQFADIVVRTDADGSRLLLGDIATINDGFEETPIKARFNGQPAVLIEIYRVGQQNAITVANQVKAYIETKRQQLPDGVDIQLWRDRSKVVKARLNTLMQSALQGATLVLLLLALFLRPAIAFWVIIGIPVAFMGGLMLMPYIGISINIISLFAFIMVLGILVDDAIVTGENVYRHLKRGQPPEKAAIIGTQEVAIPVTFGVLTTVAAFTPLLLVEGIRGKLFANIPAVVIPVLLFSLVESKLILPAHLKHVRLRNGESGRLTQWQTRFANGFERAVQRFYRPLLQAALHRRYLSLSIALAAAILMVGTILGGWTRFIYFPRIPSEVARATLTMPAGSDFDTTDHYVSRMLDAAQALQEKYRDQTTGQSLILNIFATTGSTGGTGTGQANIGRVMFEIEPPETRLVTLTSPQLVREWQQLIGTIPGAESLSFRAEIGRGGAPLAIQFSADNFDELRQVANLLKQKMREYPTIFDVEDSLSKGKAELRLQIKPEAQALGLSQTELTRQVRQAFYGYKVQRIQRGRDEVDVVIRYPLAERQSLYHLNNMMIRTQSGQEIPFSEVAHLSRTQSPATITRIDRKRTLTVSADLDKANANIEAIKRELTEYLRQIAPQYPGVTFTFEGEAKEQRQSLGSLQIGLLFVLFVIYGLLAIPFQSYWQPLVVMSVIPFGAMGAVIGHWLMGLPLTLFSLMGMLALTGVVVNDSLVLVDYINRQRRQGIDLQEAVCAAGVARFRAVLLTSITTFAGLMPLIFDKSTQAQFLIPMAVSLGFGVLFATFITLLLVPVNYLLLYDLKRASQWLTRSIKRP